MSEELQNDSVESEVIENDEITNETIADQDTGSDLAPDSEAEHEEQPQVDEEAEKLSAFERKINKKTFELKQKEREAEEYKRKIEEYERQQREMEAAKFKDIPELPDPFDDDYEQKVRERDALLVQKAHFDAQQSYYLQQQQFQQQQKEQQQREAQTKLEQDFLANAKKVGAKDEEIVSVVSTLVQTGLNNDLGNAIMADPDGYLVAKHLAANPMEAYELNSMNPILAGAKYIEIKQKAVSLKPKTTSAPTPPKDIGGKGANPESGKYKFVGNGKFE
jgi:hypothetical protein